MPDITLLLTFAELAFLLPDEASTVRDRLQLQRWEPDSPVALSGAASLFARGLLQRVEDDLIVPVEEVAIAIAAIAEAERWLEVGFARESETGGLQVYAAGGARVDVMAQPFGTYALAVQLQGGDLAETIESAVATFLADPAGGAAFVKRGGEHGDEVGLAVRRTPDGRVEIAAGPVDAAPVRAVQLAEALAEVRAFAA